MIELGKKQTLFIVKSVEFGVYLAEDMHADTKHQVLLPAKQVPAGKKDGDKIEVFIYKDSQDRLIATTNEPKLTVGEVGLLKVKQVTKIGAFLDWGLEKDLLLPYHEQTTRIFEGQECLVAVYVDKSSRLCATMKVYPYLSKETPYKEGDQVKGRVYQISENFGVFVAVDNKYTALIPAREAMANTVRVLCWISVSQESKKTAKWMSVTVRRHICRSARMQRVYLESLRNLQEYFRLMIRHLRKLSAGNSV